MQQRGTEYTVIPRASYSWTVECEVKAESLQSYVSGKLLFPCCLVAPPLPFELHVLSAGIYFPRQICLGLLKQL